MKSKTSSCGSRVSELRWTHQGQDYQVLSPANFLLFTGIGGFASDEADYDYFMSISSEDRIDHRLLALAQTLAHIPASLAPLAEDAAVGTTDVHAHILADVTAPAPKADKPDKPAPAPLRSRLAGYLIVQSPADAPEAAFAVIDAFHDYYRTHQAALRAAYERRQILAAAREAYLKENPPPPHDTVINFAPLRRR